MRLIIEQGKRYAINTAHITLLGTKDKEILVETMFEERKGSVGYYSSQENCEFAFKDLIRRLSEDHKVIEVMTDEQAQAEIKRRKGGKGGRVRDLHKAVEKKGKKEWISED